MTRKAARGFTLIEILVVITIIGLLLALLLPAIVKALCAGRAGTTKAMLYEIAKSAAAYEQDNNLYPPSDASYQSKPLVTALECRGSKKEPYFSFDKDRLDEQGNIINPMKATEFIKYRRNKGDPAAENDATAHNKWGIDLWASGCNKIKDEINNWSD